jgi:hypothetical protein
METQWAMTRERREESVDKGGENASSLRKWQV